MEEYEYLANLSSDKLVKIISEMLDFEETTEALMILEEKDSQNALALGKDIIINNKGDDFLQATVWNILFFENQKDMIDAVEERTEKIEKILLDEILIDLTNHRSVLNRYFFEKLKNTYNAIDNKVNMRCNYEAFISSYEQAII